MLRAVHARRHELNITHWELFTLRDADRLRPVIRGIPVTLPTPDAGPVGITLGTDKAMWFTGIGAGQLGRITSAGAGPDRPLQNAPSPAGADDTPQGELR
jgi:hypothetical protein